jgi:hypothetical protein
MPDPQDPNAPKSKAFKNIADLLKLEGPDAFNVTESEKEIEQLEYRRKQVDEFRKKLNEFKSLTNLDDYMNSVLKELVTKGMTMLDSLQREVEDDPRGRDVETAAAMITSIGGIVDHLHKIQFNNARLHIEQQKLDLKKNAMVTSTDAPQGSTNILMVGTTTDLLERLIKSKLIPDNNTVTVIEPPKE